jgi:hypothetical protein
VGEPPIRKWRFFFPIFAETDFAKLLSPSKTIFHRTPMENLSNILNGAGRAKSIVKDNDNGFDQRFRLVYLSDSQIILQPCDYPLN